MIKSVVLVLSERAARALDTTITFGTEQVSEETLVLVMKIRQELLDQLHRKGNSGERSAIGFDDIPVDSTVVAGAALADAAKTSRPRKSKAEKIAAEMAKATREAVEK